MNSDRLRVAVIFHRFGPYHCARLEAASRYCDVIGIELGSETHEYGWSEMQTSKSCPRVTLFPQEDSRTMPTKEIARRMRNTLRDCKPDAVTIPGWSDKGALVALSWCLETATPALLMSESTADDEGRVWWKEFVKRRLIKLYSSALVGGQRHVDYVVALGMPRDRVSTGYDVVDNDYFARSGTEIRRQAPGVRKKYELPENYFLASARFIEKKNLFTLVRAYANYRRATRETAWDLVLLGDGPLKSDLARLASDLGLHDAVVMPGFKQYDELPVFYSLANALVHPSRTEQWGLVVNEAIASGLPVIVSNRCGCVPELVRDGVNGLTFNPNSIGELTSQLLAIGSLAQDKREHFGQASLEIASQHRPERFGEGLERATRAALEAPKKKMSGLDRLLLDCLLFR